jgi:tetratricopeptide (TPR) repeat protein
VDPANAEILSELARIQTYSTRLITTDAERLTRMQQALDSADKAVKLAPEDSTAQAIRAFVLDWYASQALKLEDKQSYLGQAEKTAVKALQLDNQNPLALAYYAEILVDEQKWMQGEQYINQALERDPNSMDVHRIAAYTQESLSNYTQAIEEYQKAAEISPNMTFLYLAIGANYRQLAFKGGTEAERNFLYEKALEYFAKVTTINEQLGIKDPIPYMSIARTYTQMGDALVASLNAEKALSFDPTSPDVYGQLAIIYFKARNYEGSIPAFKCAIRGCTPDESCEVRKCNQETDPAITITGMPLTANTAVYYYTYGSVLAALHRKTQPYCDEAMKVFAEVRAAFPEDTTAMSIVKEGENICTSYGYTRP